MLDGSRRRSSREVESTSGRGTDQKTSNGRFSDDRLYRAVVCYTINISLSDLGLIVQIRHDTKFVDYSEKYT